MEKLRDLIIDDNVKQEYEENVITIKGAKHHNLKDVYLKIPKNKLIVFTGVSGSGKSSVAKEIVKNNPKKEMNNK